MIKYELTDLKCIVFPSELYDFISHFLENVCYINMNQGLSNLALQVYVGWRFSYISLWMYTPHMHYTTLRLNNYSIKLILIFSSETGIWIADKYRSQYRLFHKNLNAIRKIKISTKSVSKMSRGKCANDRKLLRTNFNV